MSLNKRIIQIAQKSTKTLVGNRTTITQITSNTLNGISTGQVDSYQSDTNTFTIQFTDGSLHPGIVCSITRLLGPGDGVTVANGAIIS